MYNFWHGVLAGYFEGVQDMDRKAEVSFVLSFEINDIPQVIIRIKFSFLYKRKFQECQ